MLKHFMMLTYIVGGFALNSFSLSQICSDLINLSSSSAYELVESINQFFISVVANLPPASEGLCSLLSDKTFRS